MLFPLIANTKSWLVSVQCTVTEPLGAFVPGVPPVKVSQMRAGWCPPFGLTTTLGTRTAYGLVGPTVIERWMGSLQTTQSNTAARMAVSFCGTSLKVMTIPGLVAAICGGFVS